MRKSKLSLLISFLFLLCFSVSKGVAYPNQVLNRVSGKLEYLNRIQPIEEQSHGFAQVRFFDDEETDDEYEEMIRKELELKKEQQKQWCLANKHFKEFQWFSEALEKAKKCIKWEDLDQENGQYQLQQEQYQIFLLKDLRKNIREVKMNEDGFLEQLRQKQEKDYGRKYLEQSVGQKSFKKNVFISRKETTKTMKKANKEKDHEENVEEDDSQDKKEEKEESNENEDENGQELKLKETRRESDDYQKLAKASKIIKEDNLKNQKLNQGEYDTSTQSSNRQFTQKQNKNYDNQVKCIQTKMEDSFIKEDFLKVISCLNEEILHQTYDRHNSSHLDKLQEHCLKDSSAVFSQKQKYLAYKVLTQISHCNKLGNSKYFSCLAEIQDEDESKLAREGHNCVEKYTLIHDDILPSCQKEFLTSLDTEHEQFQELCDLKCGQLYENFFAPLIADQTQQKYNELQKCIKNIQGNNERLTKEAINVITCVKDKQLDLQQKYNLK